MPVPEQAKIRLIMHLRQAGITDTNVLNAMETTPREAFVPPAFHDQAYEDIALPIGLGQTISQPYIVAYMTQILELDNRMTVLEIGTGSGYQTCVLARLCRRVYTIERHKPLSELAQAHFESMKLRNVTAIAGDGMRGWPEPNEFDRIIVTAAAAEPPLALLDQLKVGGIMIIPVGEQGKPQVLRRYKRESEDIYAKQDMLPVRFVPLLPDVPRRASYTQEDLGELTA